MKRQHFIRGMSALLGAVVFGPALTACGGGGEEPLASAPGLPEDAGALPVTGGGTVISEPVNPGTSPTASAAALDANEIAGLRFMREEEKLAHDVYVALFTRWGRSVFRT